MTERMVRVTVRGTQYSEGEAPQTIELVTDGLFSGVPGAWEIRYTESEMTDLAGVETCFRVSDDAVILSRSGSVNTEMVFRAGEKTESLYDVGVGALLLTVTSRGVSVELNEEGGQFAFDYTVELEHTPVGSNSYTVFVAPRPGKCTDTP